MSTTSPAQLYATLVGGVLVIAGIIGFFYDASFSAGDELKSDEVFGILAVNGWHNVLGHLAIGLFLLAVAGSAARQAVLGVGLLYLVLAVWGFIVVEDGFGDILGLIPVNSEDNWLHLILGLTGLAAGAATPKPNPAATGVGTPPAGQAEA